MLRPIALVSVGALAVAILAVFATHAAAADATAVADSMGWQDASSLATVTDSIRVEAGVHRLEVSRKPIAELLELQVEGQNIEDDPDLRWGGDSGLIFLPRPVTKASTVIVRYRYDPALLPGYVALRERVLPGSADAPVPTASAVPTAPRVSSENALGSLRIGGSKTVSVQSGSNRDATVDQGLNLSIHGRLTEGIGIRAEISDENLPITPEGNTEELTDLDQVRIELFGERGRALIGDFRIEKRLGRFAPYERKLQGLDLVARDEKGVFEVLGGSPKGERREVELRGREGVQGPYELLDGRRLDQSFIVAGSERVLVDGRELTRGTDRDFTIDYIRGTIRFTSRVPITPQSRIAIDFETSSAGYQRNVVGAVVDSVSLGPVRLNVAMLREGDDPDRPRDRSLEDDEIQALQDAGDDPTLAQSLGVRATAPGEGDYDEQFTGGGVRYFVAADSTGGDFDVDFRFVGGGAGEYLLRGVNEIGVLDFEYLGPGLGDYVVGRALPLPEVTDLGVIAVNMGSPEDGAYLSAELQFTEHDRNRFSDLDDEDNRGGAWRAEARSPWLLNGKEPASGLRASATAERIEARFHSFGRIRDAFFYEAWNLQEEQRAQTEDHISADLQFKRGDRELVAKWRKLQREGVYLGQRVESEGKGRVLGDLRWQHRFAQTRAERTETLTDSQRRDRWLRLQWREKGIVPFAIVRDERFEDRRQGRPVGYRDGGWSAGLQLGSRGVLSVSRDNADSMAADGSDWQFARDAWSARARGGVGRHETRLDADLSWRRAELPQGLVESTRLARAQFAHRRPSQGLVLDLDYRVGTDQSRVLGRRVVFIGFGKGDYDVEGKVVGVGKGDYNVVFTPSDSLVASTDVEFDARLQWRPRSTWLGGWAHSLLWQVKERSRSDDVERLLYLHPDLLRQDDTTVYGEHRLREELTLLRGLRRHDLRITHERTEVLDQRFSEGPERSRRLLSEAKLESRLQGGWALRTEVEEESRRRRTTSTLNPLQRGYDVLDRSAASAIRWRSQSQTRAELEVRYTRREALDAALKQSVLALSPEVSTSLLAGRWTIRARWAEVAEEGDGSGSRPFFFERPGSGRSAGVLAQWGGTGSLTVSLRYQITDEPDRDLRQDMSFETRARF